MQYAPHGFPQRVSVVDANVEPFELLLELPLQRFIRRQPSVAAWRAVAQTATTQAVGRHGTRNVTGIWVVGRIRVVAILFKNNKYLLYNFY